MKKSSLVLLIILVFTSLSFADNTAGQGTWEKIHPVDPPEVSTTTKPSPVGQPTTDYHPKGPSQKPIVVPPPK